MSGFDDTGISNIFNLISSMLPELTKSERKVAEFVLSERENVTNMTTMEMSQASHVSEASVVRFFNKLGFRRLIDFRIQIAKDATGDDDSGKASSCQEDEFISVIRNTSSLIDERKIKETVDLIDRASQLVFFGIAASGLAARVADDNFQRLGLNTTAITEDHFQIFKAARMTADDVVFAFSLSGNTKDIVESCSIAKRNNARIVGITSYPNSHIARISDIVLLTSAKEDLIDGGKITGYVSQLYVVEALKREYASRHREEVARLKEIIGTTILTRKF